MSTASDRACDCGLPESQSKAFVTQMPGSGMDEAIICKKKNKNNAVRKCCRVQFKEEEEKEEGNYDEAATGSLVLEILNHQDAAAAAVSSVLVGVFTLRQVERAPMCIYLLDYDYALELIHLRVVH